MPVQCELDFKEFQEAELASIAGRHRILDKARPKRCPYCGEHGPMHGHGWVPRFIIDLDGETWRLTIPVYKCASCGHAIRVLPRECHYHNNHLSQTIRSALLHKIEEGVFSYSTGIDASLQRQWLQRFKMRCEESAKLLQAGHRGALARLPDFSILFRKGFETIMESGIVYRRRESHRILRFAVCLDTG